jgi:acrylyl-CoA reductase (NADPH)
VPTFRALLLTQTDGKFAASFQDLNVSALPANDVLIRVVYSSLNYKDGLAVTGKPGVVRSWPMIPGVDLAGTVEESSSPDFKTGDEVVVTGCGTSETLWGGYAELARIPSQWIVKRPPNIGARQAMGVGTAGFTAMQCVMALEAHGLKPAELKPGGREVVVTGAAGGVGSVAIAILAHLGYKVVASTGRTQEHDYLKSLGASEIIDRAMLSAPSKKPIETERWGGAVDSVGGDTLAGVLRTMAIGTCVAACGLAGGVALNTTVIPFIIRGVNLLGIDSVRTTQAQRKAIWERLATDLPLGTLDSMIREEPLSNVIAAGEEILQGKTRGRVVIDVGR